MSHSSSLHYLCINRSRHLILNDQLNPVAKQCYSCQQVKTLNDFYVDRAGTVNRASACAECRRASNREYRESHKEYFRNYQLENRERLSAYIQQWNQSNADKLAVYSARHLKKRQEAMASCMQDDTAYKKQVTQLAYCEITGATVNLELDHIMPVTRGRWGNTRGNLLRLYHTLNSSKSDSNVFDWLEQMEQERLDYLLPDGIQMTVEQFRQRFTEVLTSKAVEKGLSLEQYKLHYNKEYRRVNNGKPE